MDGKTALYIIIGLTLLLAFITFRTGITDFAYKALKNWRYTIVVMVCVLVGGFMGTYNSHLKGVFEGYIMLRRPPSAGVVHAQIKDCKDFIIAKRDKVPGYIDPEPPLRYALKIKAKSYWDSCAYVFGTSYWQYDISIDGEDGGKLLCKVYDENGYRSSIVDSWCDTVLASR